MAIQTFYGPQVHLPPPAQNNGAAAGTASTAIDAAAEEIHFVGEVYLEGGSGSKTISAAGGGQIVWRVSTATFANSGTTMRVGIQDVSTSASPAQGDATFDVYADLVGGTDTLSNSTVYATAMESGSKTITHGDKVSLVWALQSRGGADSVTITGNNSLIYGDQSFPTATAFTGGTWSRMTMAINAFILFDDGTVGWIFGTWPFTVTSTAVAFNSGTGTADEYGNIITLPFPITADGIWVMQQPAAATSDYEICLYTGPLTSPSLIEAITVDATQLGSSTAARHIQRMFSTPRALAANTAYAITVRPTTANNISVFYNDYYSAAAMRVLPFGDNCYSVRRLDNAGTFSDYNGGTAKTRRIAIGLIARGFDDGASGGGGGGMRLAGHGGLAA